MFGFNTTMNISKLKFLPVKYKITDKIVYNKAQKKYFGQKVDCFVMFSTKKSDAGKYALMNCFPEYIERDGMKKVPSLYVQYLFSIPQNSGFGTAMLDFARIYSKQIGCGGYIHLSADNAYMPNRVPHPFYKKYGMNTGIPKIDKKIDRFIKKDKDATHNDFKMITMYYPPVKPPESKFRKFLNKLFKSVQK